MHQSVEVSKTTAECSGLSRESAFGKKANVISRFDCAYHISGHAEETRVLPF